ncbi:MAG: 3-deoxy-D-manno-octulosonic acid transferase [Alphaproteobacteria bacterium]
MSEMAGIAEPPTDGGRMSLKGLVALYPPVSRVAGVAAPFVLRARLRRGKEDAARLGERMGRSGLARPPGKLIWFHAASVGESRALLPVIERVLHLREDVHALLTTGTVTSARLMAQSLPARAVHQYVPVDGIAQVRRFLDHWRPDAAVWAESELWPNLVGQTAARGVPMLLVNARLSERSLRGWRRFPKSSASLLGCFRRVLAIDEDNAARLRRLGVTQAQVGGNLKFAVPPLDAAEAELARLREAVGGRPVWLAASTQAPEENIAASVHTSLAAHLPGLLTVLAPRHPERGGEIARELRAAGHAVAVRSAGDLPRPATEIYLADTMGELGLFYRLAPVAFVGRSLSPHGGSNPLEPARLDCAVLHGPHTENFASIFRDMNAAGAAIVVHDSRELADRLHELLTDEGRRGTLIESAASFAGRMDGMLEETSSLVLEVLGERGEIA